MKIFVPKDMIDNENVNDYDIGVYCSLQAYMRNKEFDEYYINWALIASVTYGTTNISAKIRTGITDALQRLINEGAVRVIENQQQHFIVKKIDLDFSSQFITIDYDEYRKIMRFASGQRMKLLRYYLKFISTLNWNKTVILNGQPQKGITGSCSLKHLSKLMSIAENTTINIIKKFEELQLIYVYRSECYFDNVDGVWVPVNIYGRYEHKEYILAYAKQVEEDLKRKKKIKDHGDNSGRKLFQMYYWLVKGKEYSKEEVQLIYDHIKAHNDKMNDFYIKTQNNKYLGKIKDMAIFEKFDFLIK